MSQQNCSLKEPLLELKIQHMECVDVVDNPINSKPNSEKTLLIDQFIEKEESKSVIVLNIISMTLSNIIWAIISVSFYITVICFIKKFELSPFEVSIIFISLNVGLTVSPYINYKFNKLFEKVNLIIFSSFTSGILLILEAYQATYLLLVINRFLLGILSTIINNNSFIIFIEYLPIHLRGILLSIPSIGQKLGVLLTIIIFFIFNKDMSFEQEKLSKVLVSLGFFCFLFSLFVFYFVDEGPRDMIIKSNPKKAKRILEKIHKGSISDTQFNKIEKEVLAYSIERRNENEDIIFNELNEKRSTSMFSLLFTDSKIRRLTIILSIIKFNVCFYISGWAISISLLMSHEKSGLFNLFIISILQLPTVIFLFLSEHSYIGRIGFMRLSNMLTIIILIISLIIPEYNKFLFIGISLFLTGSLSFILCNYIGEVYPNEFRSAGVYFLIFPEGFGNIISQILFSYLVAFGLNFLIVFSIIICFINLFFCFCLKDETVGKKI